MLSTSTTRLSRPLARKAIYRSPAASVTRLFVPLTVRYASTSKVYENVAEAVKDINNPESDRERKRTHGNYQAQTPSCVLFIH